jgi:hypothetical protein
MPIVTLNTVTTSSLPSTLEDTKVGISYTNLITAGNASSNADGYEITGPLAGSHLYINLGTVSAPSYKELQWTGGTPGTSDANNFYVSNGSLATDSIVTVRITGIYYNNIKISGSDSKLYWQAPLDVNGSGAGAVSAFGIKAVDNVDGVWGGSNDIDSSNGAGVNGQVDVKINVAAVPDLATVAASYSDVAHVSGGNTYLNAGDTISLTAHFDEIVNVTGSPTISLTIGGSPVTATYASGTGSQNLVFTIPAIGGVHAADVVAITGGATGTLALNSGTILNSVGNAPTSLTFTSPDVSHVVVDTVAPGAPAFALAADTGKLGTDHITNNNVVNVTSLASDVETWQYSTDHGATWTTGSGTSFTLAEGTYAIDDIQVKQTDHAGNVGIVVTNATAVTYDHTVAAPTFALNSDTGSSVVDHITSDNLVNVTLAADVDSWQYSTDHGATWTTGSGTSFTLAEATYAIGDIQVKQTDIAGNVSAAGSNATSVTYDHTVAAPSFALNSDTGVSATDHITSDNVINVTLATDVASWQYSTDHGATWTTGSGTSFTIAEATYAIGDIQVKQADIAGNVSTVTSSTTSITYEHTIATPSLALNSDTGSSAVDHITSDNIVNVTSLSADIASWQYSTDAGATWHAGSGTSFTLAEGTYAIGDIRVTQTDIAGNVSTAGTNATAVTYDHTVAAPSFALNSDTGSSAVDHITSDNLVNVTLAADVASWQYSTDHGSTWTTGSGTSFTLAEASYAIGDIQVKQTDIAGNVSSATLSTTTIQYDHTVATPSFALNSDTGSSAVDHITSDNVVNVTSLAADVASWHYSTDHGVTWSVGTGTSFTLAEGTYAIGDIQVDQTDIAGNVSSAASNATIVKYDHTVAAPTFALNSDTGSSAVDHVTSDSQVNVTLAADVASWEYSTDHGSTWTIGTGTNFALAEGTYAAGDIQVEQTDIAGNVSTAGSNATVVTYDHTVAAPSFALNADTGSSATDHITSDNVVNVTLATDVASWQYSTDHGSTWTTGSGTSFTLAEATYAIGDIQVKQTDIAGNVSSATLSTTTIQYDHTVAAPSFALNSDTGSSVVDHITSDNVVNVTSLAADVASWHYSTDHGVTWSVGSGTSFTLAEGTYAIGDIEVTQTDIAGNVSTAATNATIVKYDHTVAAPSFALNSDTGSSATDHITSDNVVNVTLATDVASWQYSTDHGSTWTTGSGTSFTLAEATYAIGDVQVKQTDIAGNVSGATLSTTTIQYDHTVAAPSFALNSDTGSSTSDHITSDNVVNVTSLASDVASWQYSTDAGATWHAGSGTSFTLSEGTYAIGDIQVEQTDIAGNVSSAASNATIVKYDHTVAAPTFALNSDTGSSAVDHITNDSQVNVTLAADAASWEYSTDAGATWTTGSGTSFTLAEGAYAIGAIQVEQTDIAGNVSTAGTNATVVTYDHTVAAPSFALHADTGSSSTDHITSDNVVNVTLATDVASWQYSTDHGSTWTTGSGTSFTLAETSYAIGDIQVKQTDIAGNVSSATLSTTTVQYDHTVGTPSFALNSDTGSSAVDHITSDNVVNVTSLDADVASWHYSTDHGATWSVGTGTSFTLAEGTYAIGDIEVTQTDVAGNVSTAATNATAVKYDHTVAAPSFALHADTGSSSTDHITSDNVVNVTLAADVDSWQYSTDHGSTWTAGTGTSFTLAEASYAVGDIQVQQTDIAGNVSSVTSSTTTIQYDHTVAAPSFVLHADTGSSVVDDITNNNVVDVTLAADVASWDYSTDAGVTWHAGTGTSFTLAEGTYAIGDIQVDQTDIAGNVSSAATNATVVQYDHTVAAPTFALNSDTGSSATDHITNDSQVNVTLATDVDSWQYSTDHGATWTTGTGTSFTLAEATYAIGDIQVEQTDIAGNVSTAGTNATVITYDQTVAAPSFALHADTGSSSSDHITNNNVVDVTLATDVASWQYSTDHGSTWTTGSGTSFTLAEASYAIGDIQVKQTDIAGNVSSATLSTTTVQYDHTVGTPNFALNSDTGSSAADHITSDNVVNVTSLDADVASWHYSTDHGATWSVGTGTSFTLAEGTYAIGDIEVTQTDVAGNVSTAASNATIVKYDHTVAAPSFALHADTGSSSTDHITNDDVVNVTLAADVASWQYSTDAGSSWTTGTGTSFTLAETTYAVGDIQVQQTDIAGNVSSVTSSTTTLQYDHTVGTPSFALHADTGASVVDHITNNNVVDVTSLDADIASWHYSTDGGTSWSTGSGTSFTLAEGTYAIGDIQVTQTDIAGNVSTAATNATIVQYDHTVATPSFALNSDTGSSATDHITNDNVVNVTLATDVDSWQYSTDAGSTWTTGTGTSFTLSEATFAIGDIKVEQTDIAGNVSSLGTNATAITYDQTVATPSFVLHADTGSSVVDHITNNNVVDVTLASDVASWEYSTDAGVTWHAGSGTSFTLAEATYAIGDIKVEQTDIAGNVSSAGTNATVVQYDHTVAAPTFALNSDTGSSAVDHITNDSQVNVTLATDVASWQYSTDHGSTWSTGSGTSFTLTEATFATGDIQVKQTDIAGNVSSATLSTTAIQYDHTVAAPTFALHSDTGNSATDHITNDNVVNVSSLASDEASWHYSTDHGATWTTGTGTSFTLAEATYAIGDIQVTQTDIAGNVSTPATNATVVQYDHTAPATTVAAAYFDGTSLILTGDHMTDLAAATTDVAGNLDWSKVTWDTDSSTHVAFTTDGLASGIHVATAVVTDDHTLTVTFTDPTEITAASNFGTAGGQDTLAISAGLASDAAGNTSPFADPSLSIQGTFNQHLGPNVYTYTQGDLQVIDEVIGNAVPGATTFAFANNTDVLTITGLSASQVASVGGGAVAGGTGDLDLAIDGTDLHFTGFNIALNGSQVKFADGSLLLTNNSQTVSAILQGSNIAATGDYLVAGNHGDTLYGYAGNDVLVGGAGNDALYGGTGDDILYGKGGNNYMTGGVGSNQFMFDADRATASHDVITDFGASGTNVIHIAGNVAGMTMADSGSDTLVVVNDHETIRIIGVSSATLHVTGGDIHF